MVIERYPLFVLTLVLLRCEYLCADIGTWLEDGAVRLTSSPPAVSRKQKVKMYN